MIGIVIIAHAGLATEFRAALEHVVGEQSQMETLSMLIRLASARKDKPLTEAVNLAKEAGRKYISVASQVLSGEA
jgi:PTS system mannose-specific IIA component